MSDPVLTGLEMGPCPGCGVEQDPNWVRGWRGWKCGSFSCARDGLPIDFKQSLPCATTHWRSRAEIAEAKLEVLTGKDPTPITKPLTQQDMAPDGWVSGIVSIHLSDAIDNDLEGWLDLLSEALVGDSLLMDITYTIVGLGTGEDELLIKVSGDASMSFKEEDEPEDEKELVDPYVCDNCSYMATAKELPDAKDLWQRLTPGGIYTDKECPECGALCFPSKPELALKT